MEKEKVLEIEFQEVFDKVAVRIKYQNFEVLKRGNFYDDETEVESCFSPEYCEYNNKLYIQGEEKNKDSKILLVNKEDFENIKNMVEKINEKYGIPKRWRAQAGNLFYYITSDGDIESDYEDLSDENMDIYNIGNYFKTEKEAQKVKNSKEWKEFWEKVRNEEIGGDE